MLLDESSVQDILLSVLKATIYNTASEKSLHDTEAALVLIESFTDCIASSASLRSKVLYLVSSNTLADPLDRFLNLDRSSFFNRASDDHKDRCPYSYLEKQMLLRRKTCMMFLKTAFFSQHDTLSLDPSIASALLDRIADMESTPPACQSHTNTSHIRRPVSLSLFETGSTPCSSARSDLWRNRIKSELAQNAEYQYIEIVRTMEDVCRDLERRCNEVEAPLRDEKARSTKLHVELDESRRRVAEISSHSHEQSLFLEGIEAEKSELVARVRDLENEQNGLVSRTEDLREELGKVVQQAEDADRIRIKEIRDLELMQAAVLAEKDEFLGIQDRKEQALKAGNERLEADVVELRAKFSVQEDEIGRLEARISDQQIELRSANTLISKSRDTLDRQEELLGKLEIDKTHLQTEVSFLPSLLHNSCSRRPGQSPV